MMSSPAPIPDWLEPMAATLTQERFTGPDWVFDRKFDGACIADLSESPALLGWRPRVGLVDGLSRTVDWFRGVAARDVTVPLSRGI